MKSYIWQTVQFNQHYDVYDIQILLKLIIDYKNIYTACSFFLFTQPHNINVTTIKDFKEVAPFIVTYRMIKASIIQKKFLEM